MWKQLKLISLQLHNMNIYNLMIRSFQILHRKHTSILTCASANAARYVNILSFYLGLLKVLAALK
uniref:Uncharacterized protein n=1 Tax=Arundo donax TaxID=35708 RepID=A0A0A9H683_ARUDO